MVDSPETALEAVRKKFDLKGHSEISSAPLSEQTATGLGLRLGEVRRM
jgi:hypothetical protein